MRRRCRLADEVEATSTTGRLNATATVGRSAAPSWTVDVWAPATMLASNGGSTSASATGVNGMGRIDSDEPPAFSSAIENFSSPVSGSTWVTDT